ncbi:uncharacterized protein LOC132727166 isoform X2 [Ruditapes philippinarum]|uniref:uncharacterized protein LOC132727166 isoform X2 n=1 Tax=Ruditapes philippinarum TaxID=129788 RepID=UPI00295B77C3|nr:uncharacterized protein LOC132727166 isoform X2 [Ruditapes philippinarum]
MQELGTAEEKGLRSSFREQAFVHVDEDVTDNEAKDKVKVDKVPVYTIPSDREAITPDMTENGGSRVIFTNGGMHSINISQIQKNYDSRTSDMTRSMRGEIRKHDRHNVTDHILSEIIEKPSPEQTDPKEDKVLFAPKLILFILIIAIFVGGVFVFVYFLKEDKPGEQRGRVIVDETEEIEEIYKSICPEVYVKLRDIIHFNCSLKMANYNKEKLNEVYIKPPLYLYEGKPFVVQVQDKEVENATWSAYFDVHANHYILRVRGPEATCSTGGEYQIGFRDTKKSTKYDTTLHISVKSEVLRVNVSLTQNTENNDTDFTLGCSTNSGCEQSFVDFFAEINKEEQFLKGVNFSCIINYNDYDGYSVSCMGNIPDYLMAQFERITCRPRSSLLDDFDKDKLKELEVEIELPECDLTKHCGYECTDDLDYYVVSRERCDIFHRCYKRKVFTSYCAPGTFFDPHGGFCACRHTVDLQWCQQNGALKPGSDATDFKCSGDE